MFGILADVLKRATYQHAPHTDMRGDWRPPVHWQDGKGVSTRQKSWRGDYDD